MPNETNDVPAPVRRLVGQLRKGDGDFIRSICDFSTPHHARRIRRIAKFIDDALSLRPSGPASESVRAPGVGGSAEATS
jgi:hypothetical protein